MHPRCEVGAKRVEKSGADHGAYKTAHPLGSCFAIAAWAASKVKRMEPVLGRPKNQSSTYNTDATPRKNRQLPQSDVFCLRRREKACFCFLAPRQSRVDAGGSTGCRRKGADENVAQGASICYSSSLVCSCSARCPDIFLYNFILRSPASAETLLLTFPHRRPPPVVPQSVQDASLLGELLWYRYSCISVSHAVGSPRVFWRVSIY